jgi:hypothetical protein
MRSLNLAVVIRKQSRALGPFWVVPSVFTCAFPAPRRIIWITAYKCSGESRGAGHPPAMVSTSVGISKRRMAI